MIASSIRNLIRITKKDFRGKTMAGSGERVAALSSSGRRAALFMAGSLLGIATAPSVSGAAFAQPPTTSLGEVVVSAKFKSERLQDTPLSISAVTGATMEARNQ